MLKSVLMAALLAPLQRQIPTRSRRQYCRADFNVLLENAMKSALRQPRDFDENFKLRGLFICA
jgi:DNA topoisomerase IA